MTKPAIIFIVLGWYVNSISAQHSLCLPVPPANTDRGRITQKTALGATGDVLISGVPSYLWQHGCGPTALGMVIGYYDAIGFSDLVAGNASTQTTEVNDAMANASHYADYSLPKDYYPTLLADKSQTGGAHASNCLADFMKTSWSIEGNYYGWSWSNYIAIAFNSYVTSKNSIYQHQANQEYYSDEIAWNTFINEIDNNRPVVLLVDSDGDGGTDHFVTGIGYNSSSKTYAVYDTWDHNVHWYTWHAMASGNTWGIWGFTSLTLKFSITATASPLEYGTTSGTGYFYSGQQVSLTASANPGYNFTNWTENGTEISTSSTYQFSASANRTIIANFEVAPPVVPETLALSEVTFSLGEIECYNAIQTIIVAGGGTTVDFESGSSATLIAGQSIQFLPGFHSHQGSYMDAYITTNGTFCEGNPAPVAAQPETKSEIQQGEITPVKPDGIEKSIKVYPNPNNGRFTVELMNFENAIVSVYSISGVKLLQLNAIKPGTLPINLPNLINGIYFLKVKDNEKKIVKKFIVN
jgi:hypothetical protein